MRLRRSGFSVILIFLPMNCQSGSWVHGAKKFGDVFVGSFVANFVDAGRFTKELVISITGSGFIGKR